MNPREIEIAVVASEWCPPGATYLITYRGYQPKCTDHTPGQPHAPCWTWVRVDHAPAEDP